MALLDLPSAVLEEIASLVPGGPRRALRAASCELRAAANAGTRSITVSASEVCRHAGTASLRKHNCVPRLFAFHPIEGQALASANSSYTFPQLAAASTVLGHFEAAGSSCTVVALLADVLQLRQAHGAAADNTAAPA